IVPPFGLHATWLLISSLSRLARVAERHQGRRSRGRAPFASCLDLVLLRNHPSLTAADGCAARIVMKHEIPGGVARRPEQSAAQATSPRRSKSRATIVPKENARSASPS